MANAHPVPNDGPSGSYASYMINDEVPRIREVWAINLEDEFKIIRQVVQHYHYIAMDTEFPGVVVVPRGEYIQSGAYQYDLLRRNVNDLKIIQLGLTFLNDKGQPPPNGLSTWQFNFKFSLEEDTYAQDSINLLIKSGIQFDKHENEGIGAFEFAELLMSSGIVLMDNIKMISFHGGYDFGYILNVVTGQDLPETEAEFYEILKLFFPAIYDVKYLMKSCKQLKGGLQEVARQMGVSRVGTSHQAGSDSLLTGELFFKMREVFFENAIDDEKYCGALYGPSFTMFLDLEDPPPKPEDD